MILDLPIVGGFDEEEMSYVLNIGLEPHPS